jgi:uncharacterized protein YndB with AHSA1/START domain
MSFVLTICLALGFNASTTAPPSVVQVTRLTDPERALRFEVLVPASLDQVWEALTTEKGLSTWIWRDVRVDLRPGGDWLVLYPGGKTGGGTVISFAPKRQLVLSAMAPEQFPTVREQRTKAVFELDSVTPGETKVVLLQTGWKQGREWDDAYEYLAAGNATLLTQLQRRFVSGPIDWTKLK